MAPVNARSNGKAMIVPSQSAQQPQGSIAMIMDSATAVLLRSSVNAILDTLVKHVKQVCTYSCCYAFSLTFHLCFLFTAICPGDCSGNGFCDESLSPPACRCDPFFIGDDCSVPRPSEESSTQDIMVTVISSLVAGGMGLLLVVVLVSVGGYWAWSLYKRRRMRNSLKKVAELAAL